MGAQEQNGEVCVAVGLMVSPPGCLHDGPHDRPQLLYRAQEGAGGSFGGWVQQAHGLELTYFGTLK